MFHAPRIEAWTRAVTTVTNYEGANKVHDRFHGLWAVMPVEKKLRWLLAAGGNGEVAGAFQEPNTKLLREPVKSAHESWASAPFFREAFVELKELLTAQWLFDNDKDGVLHHANNNPLSKPKAKRAAR